MSKDFNRFALGAVVSAAFLLHFADHPVSAEAELQKPFVTVVLQFVLESGMTAKSRVHEALSLIPRPGEEISDAEVGLSSKTSFVRRLADGTYASVQNFSAWRTRAGRVNVALQPEDGEKGKVLIEIEDAGYVFCNWDALETSRNSPIDRPIVLSLSMEGDRKLAIRYFLPTRFFGLTRSKAVFYFAIVGVLKSAQAEGLAKKECSAAWIGEVPLESPNLIRQRQGK